MELRALLLAMISAVSGCISPNVVIHKDPPASNKSPVPGPKFGEYASISEPGQFVVKNAAPTPPADDLWPKGDDRVRATEYVSKMLEPARPADPPLVLAVRDYLEGRTDKA